MEVFDLPAEYFVGSADDTMTIEEAQNDASTLDEDQDEDPEMSGAEKNYIKRMLGFDPSKWEA